MSLSAKLRRAPLRVVTGAFILNSGIGKLSADEETAAQLHGMATGTYPFLSKVNPKLFAKGLATGEVVIGSVVLAPFVSPVIAGAAVAGFSGALLNLYWKTPGMHEEGDPRPTQQGMSIAKDVWMFGIGTGLMVDGILSPAHDKKLEVVASAHGKRKGKQRRKDKRAAKKARAATRAQALDAARDTTTQLSRRAQKAADQASKKAQKSDLAKQARKTSTKALKRISEAVDEYGPTVTDKITDGAKSARSTAQDLADNYGPVVADKAKTARKAAQDLVDDYGPVVVDKAKTARSTAQDLADNYGPVVADKAKTARKAAQDLADEYGPVVVDKAKQARDAAQDLVGEYRPVVEKQGRKARKAAAKRAKRAKAAVR